MKKLKKMIAVLMSVAMIVCMFAVPASAASIFDNAVKIKTAETASFDFKNINEILYKIVLSDSGNITFYCADCGGPYFVGGETGPYLSVIDSNANTILNEELLTKRVNKKYTISKKGTYYLKLRTSGGNCYYKNLYFGFEPDKSPTVSLSLTMKAGDKISLSAITSNYNGNVTWKTTKSSVATVSNGTVTAKKKGKAQIRAYMNNGDYAEITVKVTK